MPEHPAAPERVAAQRIADLRRTYELGGLDETDLAADWHTQLDAWLTDALATGLVEPNWMVLATADASGRPSARCVLLKGFDERGLVFFTNYSSRKGMELAANPHASLVIPWVPLQRQVLVRGPVERVGQQESDDYFASRPWGSRIGAASSPQSEQVASRAVLEQAFAELAERYPEDTDVPRPEHWGGFRVLPDVVEFWQGRRNRVHDRLAFQRTGGRWSVVRLAP